MKNFFNMLKQFFAAPIFEGDEEKTSNARLLHQITLAVWAVLVLGGIVAMFDANIRSFALPAVLLVAISLVIIMRLNRSGRTHLASQIIVGIVLLGFTYLNFVSAGETKTSHIVDYHWYFDGRLVIRPQRSNVRSNLSRVAKHSYYCSFHTRNDRATGCTCAANRIYCSERRSVFADWVHVPFGNSENPIGCQSASGQ